MAKYDSYSLLSGKDRTFRKPSSVITATHVKGVDFRPEDLTFFNYLLSCSGNIKNPTGVYYVSMKDAMEFMRFERPGKIHECLERLCSGKVEVDYLDGDGNPRSLRSHYLSSDSSKAETGMIQYAFDQILVHFLIDPKVYGLISANRSNDIKSFSGKRLYEMMALQRHKWDTKWIVSLEEFRALTDTEGTHSRWDNYRRNVIEKAVGEVNAVADFEVLFSFMTSGQGGSVTTLEFDVVEKNHARLLQSKMVRSTKKKGSRLPDRDTVDMLDGKTTAERGGPAELTAAAVEEAASLIGDGNNLDNLVLEWREKTRNFSLNDPDGHFLNFVSLKVKKENDPVLNILDDEIFFNLLNGEDD